MAQHPHYNWQRFWMPREAAIRLDERGYLADPEGPLGAAYNPELVSFASLVDIPCLVLLGEPGMGKTTALHTHAKEMKDQVAVTDDACLFCNLGAFQTDGLLYQQLFGSCTYQDWLAGSHRLYLFLDSLDECRLNIKTIAALLIQELSTCPIDRLQLRITCRTAEWGSGLERVLRDCWPDAVDICVLAPLRQVDVAAAADAHGFNPQDFLEEVAHAGAAPLAMKPITLDFLLRSYESQGYQLPKGQAELYAQGCRLLCDEHNLSRRDAGFTGAFTIEDRLCAAERIAFLSMFTNRPVIWTGAVTGVDRPETLSLHDLAGAEGPTSLSSQAVLKETLTTGLFTAWGLDELIWSHQTYAEFLAAQYIRRHAVPLIQCMGLLVHPEDPGRQLVPQLYETAAWLAGGRGDLFRAIMACDPEVLLRSDVARADPEDRASLVAALLELFDQERLFDRDSRFSQRYRRLTHPQIAAQLRPYILDSTRGLLVRRVAIDIAEACEQRHLQSDLADVALNQLELYQVRIQAAWAIVRIGDPETKLRLKPLASGSAGDDPDDELRGCGLLATWPEHLTVDELFESLQQPRRENLYGSYKSFLISHCTQHLKPIHLPVALQWAVQYAVGPALRTLHSLVDEIMELACHHLGEPDVLIGFAEAAHIRMEHHAPLFRGADLNWCRDTPELQALYQNWYQDSARRQILFNVLLPRLMTSGKEVFLLIYAQPPIVVSTDFEWLIEQLQQAQDPEFQTALAMIAARVLNLENPAQVDKAYEVAQGNEYLAAHLQHIFGFIRFDSQEAVVHKADHERWQKLEQRNAEHQVKTPPPDEIFHLLNAFESGNMDAWWRLNLLLCYDPAGKEHHGECQPDLRELPGWKAADQKTRARIIRAAAQYVCEVRDEPGQWRREDGFSLYRPSFAGYRALLLLLFEDRDTLLQLLSSVICGWIPIIVGYPITNSDTVSRAHQALIKLAYLLCPEETLAEIINEIDNDDRRGQAPSLWKLEHCWDERLASALMIRLAHCKMHAPTLEGILGELLERAIFPDAQSLAERLISQPTMDGEDKLSRKLAVGRALILKSAGAGWSILWPIITNDHQFGRELILSVASSDDRLAGRVGSHLSEDALADLYLWMVQQFPHREDPQHEENSAEFYHVAPREELAHWRDALLQILKHKGSTAAVVALQRIVTALPDVHWLRWILLDAQVIARRKTWVPHTPSELLVLTQNTDSRLVDSGAQLLDLIIESLQRLEQYLQGETPGAIDLWNESIDIPVTYRPRDENRLSDYIKRHLQRDLCDRNIVINREVEIQRGGGGTPGERTDIKVDAIRKGVNREAYDIITVIIETKGCWNRSLQKAMQNQLRDRYLREYRSSFGLYLVGWFNCGAWDDKDYRQRDMPQLNLQSARDLFTKQATELSGTHSEVRAFILNVALPDGTLREGTEKLPHPEVSLRKSPRSRG